MRAIGHNRWVLVALLLYVALAVPKYCSGAVYNFKVYEHPDGLEDLVIRDLVQDRSGLIWIATHTGLYRFDGRKFRRFSKDDGLASNWITNLVEDSLGNLWVSTASGLCRRSGDRFELVLAGRPWMKFRPNVGAPLFSDRQGNVYFATLEGIFGIRVAPTMANGWHNASESRSRTQNTVATRSMQPPVQVRRIADPPANASQVSAVYPDRHGLVWFSNVDGVLAQMEPGTGLTSVADPSLPKSVWVSIVEDRQGTLWAANNSGELFYRVTGKSEFVRHHVAYAGDGKLFVDSRGVLYVPTASGFALISPGARDAQNIGSADGLPGEKVQCFLADREGGIWIGTAGSGLVRWLGGTSWRSWTIRDGLPGAYVSHISTDSRGEHWIGTLLGLARYNPANEEVARFGLPGALGESPVIYAMEPGIGDQLWLASESRALHLVNPTMTGARASVKRFAANNGYPLGSICHLILNEGTLWIADTLGIAAISDIGGSKRFERIWPRNGEPAVAYQIAFDSSGEVWAATGKGIVHLHNDEAEQFDSSNGLQSSDIFGLSISADHSIWVFYRLPLGVSQFTRLPGSQPGQPRVRVQHFREAQGLASDKVFSILAGSRGRVWAGTEYGLSVLEGGKSWVTFNRDHGLAWNDCTFLTLDEDRQGQLWVGTSKGLSRFRPPASLARRPPEVAVLDLPSGSTRIAADEAGRPAILHDGLSLTFAALRFANQAAIRFRYRLHPEDPWILTRDRELNLRSLSPGHYRLEAEASEDGEAWSGTPARFDFEVPVPWWQRWWAISLAVWLVLALFRLVWRWRYMRMIQRQSQLESAVGERTRQLVEQREKAETASKFKDQILANVSHEIRTPLNGILGFTNLMLESELDSERREQLATVQASGKSLVDIIEDLLDFASLEAGELELRVGIVSIASIIEQTTRTVRFEADKRGLVIRSSIADEVPAAVVADDHRLRQVLLNLLSNAVKFTEHGEVKVSVDLVTDDPAAAMLPPGAAFRHFTSPLMVRFQVQDTGIGIAREHIEQIFEPFRQIDGTARRSRGGTGLGLAMVRQIVEAMRGSILVESNPGQGSVFTFIVPLQPAPPASNGVPGQANMEASVDDAAPCETVKIRKVLIAEDNPVNRRLLHKMLEKRGLEVFAVCDGKAAVEAVEHQEFDLILMDVQMPVMDGIEATKAIRARERQGHPHIPVIAVTANGMFQCREQCFAVGMDGYVVKPYGPSNLFEAIDRVSANSERCPQPEATHQRPGVKSEAMAPDLSN